MLTHPNSAVWPHNGVISSVCSVVLFSFVTESYNRSVNCVRHVHFHDRGPHRLLLAGLRAARGKVIISGIPNCLNYIHKLINVAAGRKIQPVGRGLKPHGRMCQKQPCYFPNMATEVFPIFFRYRKCSVSCNA
jgi:hypothetical protein